MEFDLSEDYGPLPLWGWIAAGLGGIGLGLVIRRAMSKGSAEPRSTVGTVIPVGPVTTQAGESSNAPIGNGAWRNRAIQLAIEKGATATAAESAIGDYLAGVPLTPEQTSILDKVLPEIGQAPEPPSRVTPGAPTGNGAPVDVPVSGDPQLSGTATIITRVYNDILGRNPEPAGLSFWINEIQSGKVTDERQLRDSISKTTEAQDISARKGIEQAYIDILKRPADPGGLGYWMNEVRNRGVSIDAVRRELGNSEEAKQKA